MEDKQILQLLWQRAEQAIAAMAQRFGHRLYWTARNLVGNPQDAEECVNDTYMAIWDAIPPGHPDPLAPYVYRAGRNIALNRLRATNAQKRSGYELSLDELEGCIPMPEEHSSALSEMLSEFLRTLSREDRLLFMGRYFHALPVEELARRMGMKPNTAAVRLYRTREALRAFLGERGYRA
jgi:RNA polymerase sigma-70 factor (ECF subfamily)